MIIPGPRQKTSGPHSLPRVAVIVVNWNGWPDSLECLESLRSLEPGNFYILLVDNGSTDDSLARFKDWSEGRIRGHHPSFLPSLTSHPISWDEIALCSSGQPPDILTFSNPLPDQIPVILVACDQNRGFAGGVNAGLSYALADRNIDYVWLLNNDTVAHQSSLSELLKAMESDEQIGIAGSVLYFYEKPDVIQSAGSNKLVWPSPKSRVRLDRGAKSVAVKWLKGASLLIRKSVLDEVGRLDEKYFLFEEEKDWCIQALRHGWQVCTVFSSIIWHKWGDSSLSARVQKVFLGRSVTRIPSRGYEVPGYYESRNGIYFVKKNYPWFLIPYLYLRTLHLILQVFVYDDDKLWRLRIILRGVWDGLTGRMGKVLDPQEARDSWKG